MLEANNLEAIKAKSWGLELYFIVLYVILDWFFRQVAFTSLQGIWDELLFITIVGIWIYRSAVEGLRPRGSSILLPILLYGALMLFLFLINSLIFLAPSGSNPRVGSSKNRTWGSESKAWARPNRCRIPLE